PAPYVGDGRGKLVPSPPVARYSGGTFCPTPHPLRGVMNPGPFPARLRTLACLAVLVLTYAVPAADPGQRPVNHGDYDGWRNINDTQLSRDGKYLAYALVPEDGDGELVVRELATGREHRHAIGYRAPTADLPAG